MREAGPAGIFEGELTPNAYACSYDEYPVDPAILAQAELMESSGAYAYEIMRSKNNGIRMRRGGDNWSKPVSTKNLNRFK